LSKGSVKAYLVPVVQALLLHVVAGLLFFSSWATMSATEKPQPVPRIVKAKVMTIDPVAARQRAEEEKRKAAAQRRQLEQQRQAQAKRHRELERKQEEQKKQEQQRLAEQRKQEERKKAEQQRQAEQRRKAEAERKRAEAERLARQKQQEEARQRELELAQALDEETELLRAQSEREVAQSYIAAIQQRVIQSWQRPLSARNNMQALLMIHLLPTGEVHNVYLLQSSGDSAFDRSAVKAVQRAEKFPELQELSPRVFDAHFRKFKMLFKPEDLVR